MADLFKLLNSIINIQKMIIEYPNCKEKESFLKLIDACTKMFKLLATNEFIDDGKVRYQDYYDAGLNFDENIQIFSDYYKKDDSDKRIINYSLYCVKKQLIDFVELLESGIFTIDEAFEYLEGNTLVENVVSAVYYINYRLDEMSLKDETEYDFLNGKTNYKILFLGKSKKDLQQLEKRVFKQVMRKIDQILAMSEIIPLAESVDHVKDLTGFPLFRIHVADDYRIAYIRKNGVSVIIGVSLKSGKDSDYNRYDSIAKNAQLVYQDIDLFLQGKLPLDHPHYETIDFIQKKLLDSKRK